MRRLVFWCTLTALIATSATAVAGVVDFEDVGAGLAADSHWNGAPNDGDNTFVSNGFTFHNNYNAAWGSWSGFSYSNETDTTDYGANQWQHQWTAVPGTGAGGSQTYAVGFYSLFGGNKAVIDVPAGVDLVSADFTNNTYAYYSMLHGDSFAKKFGGSSGSDPDWFLLSIIGKTTEGTILDTVEFYLADFRFDDNSLDYIVDTWTTVDLSPIAAAEQLVFELSSSDVGTWGMNTPAYFAMDNLVFSSAVAPVPEPASAVLLATGAVGLGWLVRRRRRKAKV